MAVLRVRGVGLPDGEGVDLYADGDRWTTDPVSGADLVAEGWIVPGLVDAHTHPGADQPGSPIDEKVLRDDLHRHVDRGVTLIRSPGLASDPPAWFGHDPDVPRAVHAGPWIAQHGQFFDGWGTRATLDELPDVAAAQARRTAWVKLILDWQVGDPVVPRAVLEAVVTAVHDAGGRVAVHAQHAAGCATAVASGVDSLEHGMCLEPALLSSMAAQGIALTPTLSVFLNALPSVLDGPQSHRTQWFIDGVTAHPPLVAAAAEAGVTLLAGTDSRLTGGIVDEILALAGTGVPAHVALGAGSWTARSYLGYPGLVDGAPADAVVFAHDPRSDLTELRRPLAVVLRGELQPRRR